MQNPSERQHRTWKKQSDGMMYFLLARHSIPSSARCPRNVSQVPVMCLPHEAQRGCLHYDVSLCTATLGLIQEHWPRAEKPSRNKPSTRIALRACLLRLLLSPVSSRVAVD